MLTYRALFPQNSGYQIVVSNTIRELVRLGHEVTLFSLSSKKIHEAKLSDDELKNQINYKVHHIDIGVSLWDVAINLFSSTSFNIDKYYNKGFEDLILAELKKTTFDIIQFEGLMVSLYLPAIKKNSNAKLVFRAHNIESQVWQRLAQQKSDPFKKSYLKMHARRIRNYEQAQLNKFDAVIVFTGQDKHTIIQYGTKIPVQVLPVGIKPDSYKADFDKTEFPSLFFLGSLDWLPNREGVEWFLDNFFKDLTTGDLNVKCYIAGNDIPEMFDDYEALGKIFIQGEVDDALEFVNSKSIMIVPLLSGGGMRVKIVEGMAMQKCIISTTLGVEGINFTDGRNVLIANNPDEFYHAIKRCISDEDYCKTIGRNARQLVEHEHNITHIVTKLVAFYESLYTPAMQQQA